MYGQTQPLSHVYRMANRRHRTDAGSRVLDLYALVEEPDGVGRRADSGLVPGVGRCQGVQHGCGSALVPPLHALEGFWSPTRPCCHACRHSKGSHGSPVQIGAVNAHAHAGTDQTGEQTVCPCQA